MINFDSLKKIIEENNSFLITTHVNPDADALGSEIAVYGILTYLQKQVKIVNHSATPYNHTFLDRGNIVEKYNPDLHDEYINNVDVVIFLDLNQMSRVVSMEKALRATPALKICIDHHLNPEDFTEHYFADAKMSATGEIIYNFIEQTKIAPFNLDIAQALYAAIMTDTGSFRFDKTTPEVHRIAANLLEFGIKPETIHDKIFAQSKIGKQKLLGQALSSLKLNKTEEVCYMVLTREDLQKNGATEADLDGFVNFCLGIENVKIGILFYELSNGIKISFRSKGKIPVNELAAEFGGGGHLNAAGTRLYDSKLNDYIDKVISASEKYL